MRRYGALLAAGVTLVLCCSTTTVAQAVAPACSTVVTDDAGVLSPADLAALRKHSAGLAATTELRIRTERSLFTGTLNGDEGSLQQDCRWATSTGVRQPRLLVIMVATESRQMGIYPGTALVGAITNPVWLAIEQKDMRPHFAKADWVGGLDAAVDALTRTLRSAAAPHSPPAGAPAASSATAPSATAAAPSTTDDGQGPIASDSDGSVIQGDGSAGQPVVNDPPGSQGLGATTSDNGSGGAFIVVFVLAGIVVVAGAVFGLARGGRAGRRNGHYGPDGAWINTPPDAGHHNTGMFGGGGGFDGGGGGDSGGGGSSSDGGGGSSGF